MGLAFDLNADDIGGSLDWEQAFTESQSGVAFQDFFGGGTYPIAERWDGIVIDPAEFDIIIRNTYIANGNLVVIGSYRGAFTDNPHSITDFEYAWDGFIAITRSFKWTGGLDSNYDTFIQSVGYRPFYPTLGGAGTMQILPMRMPYEWKPGGTAAQIAADSSVGLYGIDFLKDSTDDAETFVEQGNLLDIAVVCGFGRIDGSSENALSDQDYIAAAYQIPIQWEDYVYNVEAVRGSPDLIPLGGRFPLDGQQCVGYTWRASVANHTDNTPSRGRFTTVDLDQWLSDNTVLFPSNLSGSAPAATLEARGYYPRRFLSVATAILIDGWGAAPFGPFVLAGDSALDDGLGAVDYYSPLTVGVYGTYPTSPFGPVPQQILMTGRTDENVQLEDTGTAYDLQGSWFSHVVIPNDVVGPGLNGITVPTILLCENTDFGGSSRQASIYVLGGIDDPSSGNTTWFSQCPYSSGTPPSAGATSVFAYAVPGGAWETATGLTLPDRWTATAAQSATFTRDQEGFSKSAMTTWSGAVGIIPPVNNPVDENGVSIGIVGNYIRVGTGNTVNFNQGSQASNVAICLLGYTGVLGSRNPSVLVFDAGTVSATVSNPTGAGPYDLDSTGYFTQVGSALESVLLQSDSDAIPISAGWDNDRDQWLFGFARPTVGKMALISARSDFKEFIDQSSNIIIPFSPTIPLAPAGYSFGDSIIFRNRLQTNELDGVGIGGDETDVSGPGVALSPIVDSDGFPHSNFVVVKGTTGRVARVWVDYVLYDGVDALVATKVAELGLQVTPENVEWFKARILRSAGVEELDVKTEEIEAWMEAQRKEYTDMLRTKERSGRLRKRRSQISAYREGVEGALGDANKSSVDTRALDPEDLDDLLRNVGMPDDGYRDDRERS